MTQATHTRGPWAISRNATPDYAPQFSIYGETGGNDLAIVKGDNAASDAALIAAAPELLESLELAEGFISGFEDDELQEGVDWLLETIRAAIVKAGGQAA